MCEWTMMLKGALLQSTISKLVVVAVYKKSFYRVARKFPPRRMNRHIAVIGTLERAVVDSGCSVRRSACAGSDLARENGL